MSQIGTGIFVPGVPFTMKTVVNGEGNKPSINFYQNGRFVIRLVFDPSEIEQLTRWIVAIELQYAEENGMTAEQEVINKQSREM